MTFLYFLLGAFTIWVAYKLISKPREARQTVEKTAQDGTHQYQSERIHSEVEILPTENFDKDEWEGSFWEVSQPLSVKTKLRLKYIDGADRKTERIVDVRQFGAFGSGTLLIGHCHMRNATRTFRSDRIESCLDEETGEVVNDIRTYLQTKYDNSPDKSKGLLLESEYDTLRILLYVGKADGQLRAAEKAVIRETCIAITNDSRLTESDIEDMYTYMATPTLNAFKLAVGRLAKRDENTRSLILSTTEKMIATQKTVHHAEQEALDYMKKRFSTDV
jgi:hypothetical protein